MTFSTCRHQDTDKVHCPKSLMFDHYKAYYDFWSSWPWSMPFPLYTAVCQSREMTVWWEKWASKDILDRLIE